MNLLSFKKYSEFTRIKYVRRKIKIYQEYFCLILCKSEDKFLINPHDNKINHFSRFGILVTKHTGNAVFRNKIKRIIRSQMRSNLKNNNLINHYDYLFILKSYKNTNLKKRKNIIYNNFDANIFMESVNMAIKDAHIKIQT